ncbi:MAG: hypothetical protein JSU03_03130 [Bacteroidetes bacterium]|nr:hypothetical protein [Bacteroidota bacterium]MBS1756249.1 hypothetical protein [Bacteroidota bacterium]
MLRTIQFLFFGLLLSVGLLSCEKEYSIENGGGGPINTGSAVFTFDGAPGACLSPVINGNYSMGVAMVASNNVILTVNVVTAGTYTISTGSVNGVSFSATSSFSQTGPAIIQLIASGTPTAAGTFNYTPGSNGCAFSVTFTGGGSSSGTANYTCTSINATGTYTSGSTLGTSNTLVLQVNVTTAGNYSINTGTVDGFGFSGSGTLATGAQTIILPANGIPASAGTASFTIGSSCTATIPVAPASSGGTDFLKGTITGTSTNTFNTGLSGVFSPYSSPVPGTLTLSGSAGTESVDIAFMNTTGNITATTYKNVSLTNLVSGVVINYVDNASNTWTSSATVANTCTATITSITSTRVNGTFSGTLYNSSGTLTKTITNGSFSVPL